MARQAKDPRTPTLWYWPTTQSGDRTQPPTASQHCGWKMGEVYISATPDRYDMVTAPPEIGYRLDPEQTEHWDEMLFGHNIKKVEMPDLNADAMVRLGRQILTSAGRVRYRSAAPPFNNAIVAMLLLIAGMEAEHRNEFRQKYFLDPTGYSWRWGRSPFPDMKFSRPEEVYLYCLEYRARGTP